MLDFYVKLLLQVIQRYCHGIRSTSCQQEESERFHFSFPLSMETQTNDWDSDVQVRVWHCGRTFSLICANGGMCPSRWLYRHQS